MKYVMFSVEVGGVTKLVPIIFPDFMVHEDVAIAIKSILEETHKFTPKIESAGDIDLGRVECSGESETLKLKSRAQDSHIINQYNYFHGLVY